MTWLRHGWPNSDGPDSPPDQRRFRGPGGTGGGGCASWRAEEWYFAAAAHSVQAPRGKTRRASKAAVQQAGTNSVALTGDFDGWPAGPTQTVQLAMMGGMAQSTIPRPDPVRWLGYAFGGTLGPRYREWVLYDFTSRARWVRHVVRAVVEVMPLAALVMLIFGFGWISLVALVGGLLLSLMYSVAFFNQSAEHQLLQHGIPWGPAQWILSEHDRAKNPERMSRDMQTHRNGATQAGRAALRSSST